MLTSNHHIFAERPSPQRTGFTRLEAPPPLPSPHPAVHLSPICLPGMGVVLAMCPRLQAEPKGSSTAPLPEAWPPAAWLRQSRPNDELLT